MATGKKLLMKLEKEEMQKAESKEASRDEADKLKKKSKRFAFRSYGCIFGWFC